MKSGGSAVFPAAHFIAAFLAGTMEDDAPGATADQSVTAGCDAKVTLWDMLGEAMAGV